MRRYVACTETYSSLGLFRLAVHYRYFRWRWLALLWIAAFGGMYTKITFWRSHIVGRVTVRTDLA